MTGLSLALTLTATGICSNAASAIEPTVVAPAPSTQWCLHQRDGNSDQPACYESLITCVVAALAHASWCTHRVPENVVAMNRRAPSVASVPRHRMHASLGQHKFTAAERDDLYQAFEKWKGPSPGE
jgi:glucose/arabinose dehydrogenase